MSRLPHLRWFYKARWGNIHHWDSRNTAMLKTSTNAHSLYIQTEDKINVVQGFSSWILFWWVKDRRIGVLDDGGNWECPHYYKTITYCSMFSDIHTYIRSLYWFFMVFFIAVPYPLHLLLLLARTSKLRIRRIRLLENCVPNDNNAYNWRCWLLLWGKRKTTYLNVERRVPGVKA